MIDHKMKTQTLIIASHLLLLLWFGLELKAADPFEKETVVYKEVGPLAIKADVYHYSDTRVRPVLVSLHGGALIMGHRENLSGPVRDFAGLEMKGGTIVLRSGAELRTGAWMQRGTIISLRPIPLLPSFLYSSSYVPTFMGVLARHLASLQISLPVDQQVGVYQRFLGDTSVVGKGEILVWGAHTGA